MTTCSELLIERIVQPNILTCAPDAPIFEAAQRMNEARCSSILVMEAGKAVGIWTERDTLAIDFSDPEALQRPISAVMHAPVKTLHYQCTLGEAALRFREMGVRHFLVVDDAGGHVGMITQTDVVNNQGVEYYILLREVRTILKSPPVIVPGSLSLSDAARRMREMRQDALVVEGAGGELGILTERDVLRFISGDRPPDGNVWNVASKPLITVAADSSLYKARNTFAEKHIRHLGVTGADGQLVGLVAYSDILAGIEHAYVQELQNALKEREETLNLSNRRLRLAERVFETTFEGIMVTDANSVIESVNPAFTKITGYGMDEVVGKKPAILSSGRHDQEFYRKMQAELAENGCWQGEIWNRRKDGEIYPEWLSMSTVKNREGEITNYVAIFSDITERKASEDHVRHLAHHDALTNLPNRMLLLERLGHALVHAHRQGSLVVVMFLDLDRFKIINDTLGHAVGDQLLKVIAGRLAECVREDDTVARLGGDEFIILLEDVVSIQSVAGVAQKLIHALETPVVMDHQEMFVTTSIGISVYPDDGDSADALIQHADTAMYRAKERGRNNYQFFTADMNARAFERLAMENSLRHALERNEFLLHYQPQVDTKTRRITGMEALLRWQHPDFGLVSPAQFIPIAEETGLIVQIGEWALRAACFQNKAWQDAGLPRLHVAVNLSARQFKQSGLVKMVSRALEDSGLEPAYLEIEITESIAMEHADDTIATLHELKAMGVQISMDDFGTGHSSLSYLMRFPIDTLKIDQSFIQNLTSDSGDSRDDAIAAAITTMARSMKMKVVSEGVETKEQMSFLRDHDRQEVQGYYFSQPLPAEAFSELLGRDLPFD
ncbi:MAG: EAL domain-containing protein [Betaproteobacteria bacterium]|nr:EAL domain-containing protein [Betaproteobacteria bacterium]